MIPPRRGASAITICQGRKMRKTRSQGPSVIEMPAEKSHPRGYFLRVPIQWNLTWRDSIGESRDLSLHSRAPFLGKQAKFY